MADPPPICRHCESRLARWLVPEDASWSEEFFYVCFNDDCSYYKEGWIWMKEQYNQSASYRYAINPASGASMMIPVWSDAATRGNIEASTPADGRDIQGGIE